MRLSNSQQNGFMKTIWYSTRAMSFTYLGKNTKSETFYINTEMKNSSEEKILGITIDNKLNLIKIL